MAVTLIGNRLDAFGPALGGDDDGGKRAGLIGGRRLPGRFERAMVHTQANIATMTGRMPCLSMSHHPSPA